MRSLLLLLIALTAFGFGSCAQQTSGKTARHFTAAEVKKLVQQNPEIVILDVRTPEEFSQGHLQRARNIDFYAPDFEARMAALDTTKTYLLYCASGNRSGKAAAIMESKNFSTVFNSTAGFQDLKSAGVPVK